VIGVKRADLQAKLQLPELLALLHYRMRMVRLIKGFLVIRGVLVISIIWVISTISVMCVIRLIQYGTFIRVLS